MTDSLLDPDYDDTDTDIEGVSPFNTYQFYKVSDIYSPLEDLYFDPTLVHYANDPNVVIGMHFCRLEDDETGQPILDEDGQEQYDDDKYVFALESLTSQYRHDIAYFLRLFNASHLSTNAAIQYNPDTFKIVDNHLHLVYAVANAYFNGLEEPPPAYLKWLSSSTWITPEKVWASLMSIWDDRCMPPHIRTWFHRFATAFKFKLVAKSFLDDIEPNAELPSLSNGIISSQEEIYIPEPLGG